MTENETPMAEPVATSPVDAAIKEIEAFAKDSRHWKTVFSDIECIADKHVTQLLDAHKADLGKLADRLKDRRGRLPLSTGITDQILGISKQVLAFGAAGLALAIPFIEKARGLAVPIQKALAVAALFYGQLVLLSLFVLVLYMLHARFRYPFLYFQKIGNAWPYFYYSSISRDTPRSVLRFPSHTLLGGIRYAQDFVRFVDRSVSESDELRARNELQQYFILMAYQGYVNQFSLRLTNWFLYGFVGTLVSTLVLSLWAFLF